MLSPNKDDQGVWVNQDAWFNLGKFTKGNTDQYKIQKTGNGVYVFVLEGEVKMNGDNSMFVDKNFNQLQIIGEK